MSGSDANVLPSVRRAACAPPEGSSGTASSLPTGHRVVCTTPEVPGVRDYVVLHLEPAVEEPSAELLAALVAHAHAVARARSMERFGHAEGWSLLVNGSATRRTRGVHVHVVLSDSLRAKRRAFAWLQLKHLTRPLVRVFRRLRRDHVLASG